MNSGDSKPQHGQTDALIGPEQFRAMLEAEFPGTLAKAADLSGKGLLHLELSAFRRTTEEAIDAGELGLAELHFKFIERIWPHASPALDNAIGVSYVEDFALEWTPKRHAAVRERMPHQLRSKLVEINKCWQ